MCTMLLVKFESVTLAKPVLTSNKGVEVGNIFFFQLNCTSPITRQINYMYSKNAMFYNRARSLQISTSLQPIDSNMSKLGRC